MPRDGQLRLLALAVPESSKEEVAECPFRKKRRPDRDESW